MANLRRWLSLVGVKLLAVTLLLGACSSGSSTKAAPSYDKTFVVAHQGVEFCGYLTDATYTAMCGNSGVPEENQLSPEAGEDFDTDDGVDADDRLVAFLVCGNLITRLPANLQSDSDVQTLWQSWTAANTSVTCGNYTNWIAAGEPNATKTHKPKKPRATKKPAARPSAATAPTTARPTPSPTCTKRPTSKCRSRRP